MIRLLPGISGATADHSFGPSTNCIPGTTVRAVNIRIPNSEASYGFDHRRWNKPRKSLLEKKIEGPDEKASADIDLGPRQPRLLAAAAGYLLSGGKNAGVVHADSGVATQKAADAAGARVLPSELNSRSSRDNPRIHHASKLACGECITGVAAEWRLFARLAVARSRISGRPLTFLLAVTTVLAWAITGPLFDFTDTWQLVINTGTTIVHLPLIQATQNRDTLAHQVKLDELILATKNARNGIAGSEKIEKAKVEVLKRAS